MVVEALGQFFHRVPSVRFSLDLALNYLPARIVLGREIRRILPDVVHAWGAELIYPAALRDFKGPRVFSLQGSLTEYQRIGGLPRDWRWRKMVASEPGFILSATVVTAESSWAAERVRELDPAVDCRIVDYGVHPSFYATPWTPDRTRPYVLYVGGGGYRKGTDVLFESLALLKDRGWDIYFAGDSDLEQEIITANLPRTQYLGLLHWEQLLKALSKASCLVVPTRGDTGPTVVKEARVVGLPVIGTLHGGLRDYIRHGESGWIVNPLDPPHLAEALVKVMASTEQVLNMGHSHHAEDREFFSPERTAAGFSAIYHELA